MESKHGLTSFHQPAEWEPHRACWLAWPSAADLWEEDLPGAQTEFAALCRHIGASEKLEILVPDEQAQAAATKALHGLPVRFHLIPFGDIWLRDTAPIFLKGAGEKATVQFQFNGWGGKYDLPHDPQVASRVARAAELPTYVEEWVLEGGSVEPDGEGTLLTSRQCLLNENRNPSLDEKAIEAKLKKALGVEKVLWLGDGLLNDHTDGHIDTIARFVAPGEVVCMEAKDASDPNFAIMNMIAADLASFTDARGRKLKVHRVPSPGSVLDEEGELMPASYLNFYIANKTVIVPTYGEANDKAAVAAIAKLFPGRQTVGSPAKRILTGGGAFHCITQQEFV